MDTDQTGTSPYFAISTRKLVLMSVFTLGLYELWWFYKQWARIKQQEQSDIAPAWRAVFTPIWAYACFARIRTRAKALNVPVVLPAGPLAVGWFVTLNLWRLPDPYWLVCYLSVIWLVPVQIAANRINAVLFPGLPEDDELNKYEIAMVVVGFLMLMLIVLGLATSG